MQNSILGVIFIVYILINIIGVLALLIPFDTACNGFKGDYGYKTLFKNLGELFLNLNVLSLIILILIIPAIIFIILISLLIITLKKIYKRFEKVLTYQPFKKRTK